MKVGYRAAVDEARAGLAEGGIPIGAALERNGNVVAVGRNLRVQSGDPTAHAEITCLRAAGRLYSYEDTVLYTTLTPCALCTGAVLLFGIPLVVIGDTRTFDGEGSLRLLQERGVKTEDIDDAEVRLVLSSYIDAHPVLWREDIGHH